MTEVPERYCSLECLKHLIEISITVETHEIEDQIENSTQKRDWPGERNKVKEGKETSGNLIS